MTTKMLAGRSAVITGGSRGLGLAIARAYVEAGADVLVCGRDAGTLSAAIRELQRAAGGDQRVLSVVADVSNVADAERVASEAIAAFAHVDVLVNNAGVYGPIGPIDEIDWRAWADAVSINLHGSVLACRVLLPHFKARNYGKIIQLSGGGATAPLPRLSAYAASKAAVVRFAETLAAEVEAWGIDVNAMAPGALDTRLLDEVIAAGPDRVGADFHQRMLRVKAEGGTPLDVGAALAVFLGSAASDGITGRLLSAVWDPWEQLPQHRAALAASDIYTLRRIVPRDRGQSWGDR